jgi:uncharacterized phiE125 gp8 family phage protein
MALETLVAPAAEPVSLAEARAFLRIGTDGDDGVLTQLLIAAREAFEARTGRALVTATFRQRFMAARFAHLDLPCTLVPGRIPATNLVAVRLIAQDGTETAAPANLVRLIDGRFVVTAPLNANVLGLSIDFQAGHGTTAGGVPQGYKVSILEAVADALKRRDGGMGDGGQSWDPATREVKL